MTQMIRKQVYIEPRHDDILKRLSRTRGATEAQIIRSAIDREAKSLKAGTGYHDTQAWADVRAFIRSLMGRGVVNGKRSWKREEIYADINPIAALHFTRKSNSSK